jgi:PPOX class probable F420-dependent enzyme
MDALGTIAHPELLREPVAWLGTSTPDGEAALVPTWFAWDGQAFLVASKPGARKVRNAGANPHVMLGIARVGVEMDAQLVEGCAEVLPIPSRDAFRGLDLSKYEALLAADGLSWDAFFARYPAVIRIVPARFLPWQGPALARAG